MTQLFLFGPRGTRTHEPGACRSCGVIGRWAFADCGFCRKEAKRSERRRWYTHCGLDRAGKERTSHVER